jgi:polyhydroxybutyrate depolymerase
VPTTIAKNDTDAASLHVSLHGAGTVASFHAALTGFSVAGDEERMITAYPEGTGSPQVWHPFDESAGADDLAFVSDLIAHLTSSLCIDSARVYVSGFSFGGSIALQLACARPDLVRAVAVVGTPHVGCQGAVSLIAFHGEGDPIAPYEGRAATTGGRELPRVETAIADWAAALGCDAPTSSSEAGFDVARYGGCKPAEDEVELYTVHGAGHTWPGAAIELPTEVAGATSRSLDATDLILEFFAARAR